MATRKPGVLLDQRCIFEIWTRPLERHTKREVERKPSSNRNTPESQIAPLPAYPEQCSYFQYDKYQHRFSRIGHNVKNGRKDGLFVGMNPLGKSQIELYE